MLPIWRREPPTWQRELRWTIQSNTMLNFNLKSIDIKWSCSFIKELLEEKIDEIIEGSIAPGWQVFVDITLRCVKLEPDERPTMGEVEVELEFALSLQKQADRAKYSLFSTTITPPFHLIPASWDLRTLHGTNFPMVQIFQWYKYSSRS